jgi:hypothetical protein
LGAGQFNVDWECREQNGRELASGIYLLRLQAMHECVTKKVLVLR